MDGVFYELAAVFNGYGEVCDARMRKDEMFNGAATVTKTAGRDEVAKWPELASFRGRSAVDTILKPAVLVWKQSARYR